MTMDDANMLLALAKANYSYAFKGMSQAEKVMLVKSWAFALQDIPADIVMLAFMQLLTTSKWLPTVADIRAKVKDLYMDVKCSRTKNDSPYVQAAKKYIDEHTWQYRGDGKTCELSLDDILSGAHMVPLGTGNMGFLGAPGDDEGEVVIP